MKRPSGILLAFAYLSAFACSDPSGTLAAMGGSSNTAGTIGAADTAGNGGNANAAGTSGSTGSSSAGSANADKTGQVVVNSPVFSGFRSFYAEFWLTQTATPCEQMTYGDCVLTTTCADNSAGTTYASAGTLTLTSLSPQLDVSIDQDSSGVYPGSFLSTSLSGGETLHVAASGGTVPAFSSDLTFPLLIVVDQPTADSTGLITVPTTQDLVLSFSRATDTVQLLVQGATSTKSLSCNGDSSSSKLTVAAAALAALGSGTKLQTYTIGITRAPITGWNVKLGTVAEAITPDHKAAVTIQIQ